MCREWFSKFRSDDFGLSDKPRYGRPQELKSDDLQALLDRDDSRSSVQLAKQLPVDYTSVLRRLHTMGKLQKGRKMDST